MTEELELEGTALKIYWYLLKNGEGGIREIQRELKIKSSGTISYQINKLIDLGIVSKHIENEKYFIQKEIKTGNLSMFMKFGDRIVPRYYFYATFFLSGLFFYLLTIIFSNSPYLFTPIDLIFIIYIGTATVIFCVESILINRLKPK